MTLSESAIDDSQVDEDGIVSELKSIIYGFP